jgi:hypothetical protein
LGRKYGGETNISCNGLKEVEIIQKKGNAAAMVKIAALQ